MQSNDSATPDAFQYRLVHNAWLQRTRRQGEDVPDEAARLVWELLTVYQCFVADSQQTTEDSYKAAYDLATQVLQQMQPQDALRIYRDLLIESILEYSCRTGSSNTIPTSVCKKIVGFGNLISSAFCEANSDLLKKTIRHERAERLTDELRLAKRIQLHLLPKAIPDIPGFQFAGRLIPAQEIGGDYWSVKHKKDGNIVTLKLADITGHGLAAATLVAAVKFISGGFYQGSTCAAEVMKKTNRVLTIETPRDIMVTMVYGWLHPETSEIDIVNAGHSPVFLCSGDSCMDIPATGPVLGVIENADYEELRFRLSPGDILFFGSDGITEAGTVEPFGIDRLKEVVKKHSQYSADKIADSVVDAVMNYAVRPHDDISLLVVKAVEKGGS
jgi:hypothetical protein